MLVAFLRWTEHYSASSTSLSVPTEGSYICVTNVWLSTETFWKPRGNPEES